ncbi:MAG: biosynthetic-type acetolactate synthase large subunit [Eggerthellaceae bacterium]|nr:biosynthetic-type acetolactate synthase large subunit [Eggerthellaceae bacterium]
MTGAQAVIASLQAAGVEFVFGYPGGQAVKLFDALFESDIQFILSRHEQAAVHEADGYARATGKPGVVLVTSGPGATNTVTGIATAYMDSVPLILITAQVPTSVIGTDSFQEADIFGITLPVVKHSYLLRNVKELPETFAEAFHVASTGRPGPVLIDVPSDVASASLDFSWPETVNTPSYKPTVKGNAKQIRKAAALIGEAQKPLIIAGGGAASAHASEVLTALVDTMQIPVVTTLMGKTALPSAHPLNLGHVGMHGSKYANEAIAQCDLLICAGTHLSDRVTGQIAHFAERARVIHIDIDPAEIGKVLPTDVPIVGDLAGVLSDIVDSLRAQKAQSQSSAWLAEIEAWKARWPFYSTAVEEGRQGIVPEDVIMELSHQLAGSASIVTTEVGQHQMWAAQFMERETPRSFITSGGLGTMGFGFPAAIGAGLGVPKSQVICIAGDGSLQMNIQEMATAIEAGVSVKVLLMDNASLGMVHQWQTLFYGKRFSATEFSANPDFVALAQAYGWQAARVSSPDDVAGAIKTMLEAEGCFLLDVAIPRDANVYPMVPPGGATHDALGAIDLAVGAVRLGLERPERARQQRKDLDSPFDDEAAEEGGTL